MSASVKLHGLRAALLGLALCTSGALAQAPAPVPTPTQTSTQSAATVLVGMALPQTGMLADLATGQRNAMLLWQERINAAGGLAGRKVELRVHDDASEAVRATRLYEQLINDDKAEILIGPFGSAATSMAAAVADRARRVMINVTGTSPAIHKRGPRWLFQVPPASDQTQAGVIALAKLAGVKTLSVATGDPASAATLIEALKKDASAQGIALAGVAPYEGGDVVDLSAWARKLGPAGSEGLLSDARVNESGNLLRGLRTAGMTPKIFIANGVGQTGFVARVGIDAEFTVGYSNYEPAARTPGNAEFVRVYRDKYKRDPDFAAACGWAAMKVLEEAVRRAGSFDSAPLRAALSALETETVLGAYKVDVDGAQVGARPFMVQFIKGRRQVVWPEAYASASAQLPAQPWAARELQPRKR